MSTAFEPPQIENPPVAAAAGDSVVDVTSENFMVEVIEASQAQLVLLDLWAPWCGPCKQLTPVLEKLAAQSDGAVRLAKMNIDEHKAAFARHGRRQKIRLMVWSVLERAMRFELTTPTLARLCSTPELRPHRRNFWPIGEPCYAPSV